MVNSCIIQHCQYYGKQTDVPAGVRFHQIPSDPVLFQKWKKQLQKSLGPHFEPKPRTIVCSTHFVDGKKTAENPIPTLNMVASKPEDETDVLSRKRAFTELPDCAESPPVLNNSLTFNEIVQENQVQFYTGFSSSELFHLIFQTLMVSAKDMKYWNGTTKYKRASSERVADQYNMEFVNRGGRPKKLGLEQEFLMVMMRLRLGLLVEDLAFRFMVSPSTVSRTLITWIKLMSKVLGEAFVIFPSRDQIRAWMPPSFRKFYPKARCIIDCAEIRCETPSSLEAQAQMYSNYKHACTIKYLVVISPVGLIVWLSPAYGGRASDNHIVRDSDFLRLLEPGDQVMADRGFKIRTDLATVPAELCIPPRAVQGNQMTEQEVKETSRVANLRIYVEQAIQRMKVYRILTAGDFPVLLLPIVDDILITIAALCNLKGHLCNR